MLEVEGYNLAQADHLNDVIRSGVCIYHIESLTTRAINLPYFKEGFPLEMSYNNNKSDCIGNLR